jgi:hypothetical protein
MYLYDLIVVDWTFQEQLDKLQKVFQRCWGAHLKINPKKWQLLQVVVWYLGHIESLEEWLQTQRSWRLYRSGHHRKMNVSWGDFLVYVPIAGRFIAGFVDIARPLIQPTEEKWTFQSSQEAAAAFWSWKKSLYMAPILGYLHPGERFIDMGMRSMGIGGKLFLAYRPLCPDLAP